MDSLAQIEAANDGSAYAALAQALLAQALLAQALLAQALHEIFLHQILIPPDALLRDRPEPTIADRLIGMPVPMVSRES
jgi:hypothetical protein